MNIKLLERILLILVVSLFISPYAICIAITGVLIYLLKIGEIQKYFSLKTFDKYMYIFLALTLLISVINLNPWGIAGSIFMGETVIVCMYLQKVMSAKSYNKMLNWVLYASVIAFGYAIVQTGNPELLDGRAESTFKNANVYAMMCEFTIIICTFKLIETKNSKYILYMIFNFLGLYLTGCRTAWFVLVVAAMTMLVFKKHFRVTLIVASICILAFVFTISHDLFPRLDTLAADLKYRIEIWAVGIKGFIEHPLFGQGPFTYSQIYETYGGSNSFHSHNIIIDMLLNFGIIPLTFLVLYSYNFSKKIRKENVLIVGIITVVIVHGQVDLAFFFPQTFMMLMLLFTNVGIINLKRIEKVKSESFQTMEIII